MRNTWCSWQLVGGIPGVGGVAPHRLCLDRCLCWNLPPLVQLLGTNNFHTQTAKKWNKFAVFRKVAEIQLLSCQAQEYEYFGLGSVKSFLTLPLEKDIYLINFFIISRNTLFNIFISTCVILTTTLALMTITLLRGPVPISARYFS